MFSADCPGSSHTPKTLLFGEFISRSALEFRYAWMVICLYTLATWQACLPCLSTTDNWKSWLISSTTWQLIGSLLKRWSRKSSCSTLSKVLVMGKSILLNNWISGISTYVWAIIYEMKGWAVVKKWTTLYGKWFSTAHSPKWFVRSERIVHKQHINKKAPAHN